MSWRRALSALLVVQAGLVVLTWWPEDPEARRPRPVLDWSAEEITGLRIARKPVSEGAAPDAVELVRGDAGWQLASASGYPADPSKVDDLVERLTALRIGPAVAEQPTSWEQLKVGEDEYGRRVTVRAGDAERVLVLGAAANDSVNLRLEGEPQVYRARGASEWSFSELDSAYYDSQYVAAAVEELAAATVVNLEGTLAFLREGEGWTLADLAEGEQADSDAIATLLGAVTSVRMSEPVGPVAEARSEWGLGTGALRVDWTIAAEDRSEGGGYEVGAEIGSDQYVQATGATHVVRARQTAFDALRNAKREDFVTPAAPAAPEGPGPTDALPPEASP